ncbi:MAG: radical SAM protein [Adlercreutzia equolifaciens]
MSTTGRRGCPSPWDAAISALYCIVPYVRGREKSRRPGRHRRRGALLCGGGRQGIALLGQNVNSYGRDLYGEPRFAECPSGRVDAAGIERPPLRDEPSKDLADRVIGPSSPRCASLMPALHLPVQSGSNRHLSAMNRRYTREHYLGLIEKLRRARPDIALSTDIIVGFPGETEEDFMDTYRLVEEVGYSQVFTFIYSKREGTPAAEMDDDTPREVIQERFDRLVDLVQRKAFEANQAELGATVPDAGRGRGRRGDSILAGKSPKNPDRSRAGAPSGTEAAIGGGAQRRTVTIEEARTRYLSGTIVSMRDVTAPVIAIVGPTALGETDLRPKLSPSASAGSGERRFHAQIIPGHGHPAPGKLPASRAPRCPITASISLKSRRGPTRRPCSRRSLAVHSRY